jgi:hypothetical protein
VNYQTGGSGSALQSAALKGSYIAVKLLLDRGAGINAQGGEYGNALQAAAWRGSEAMVKLLLDNGADVNAQGGEYLLALDTEESIIQRESDLGERWIEVEDEREEMLFLSQVLQGSMEFLTESEAPMLLSGDFGPQQAHDSFFGLYNSAFQGVDGDRDIILLGNGIGDHFPQQTGGGFDGGYNSVPRDTDENPGLLDGAFIGARFTGVCSIEGL